MTKCSLINPFYLMADTPNIQFTSLDTIPEIMFKIAKSHSTPNRKNLLPDQHKPQVELWRREQVNLVTVRRLVAEFPLWRSGFETDVRSCGICGEQSGASYLLVLQVTLLSITPTAPHTHIIIIHIHPRGWYSRPKCGRHTKYAQYDPHHKKLRRH
jgi:hypothetical protein